MNKERPGNYEIQKADEYPVGFPVQYEIPREEEIHLRDYLRVILRRKWTLITFFVVVVTTVVIATFLMTPVYRATVTLKLDKENPKILSFKDAFEIEQTDELYYQTQHMIMKSRSLAKRVIRNMKLEQNPQFMGPEDKAKAVPAATADSRAPEPVDAGVKDSSADRLLGQLTVEPVKGSRLVKMSIDSTSPQLAAGIANEMARAYIDLTIESKFDATLQAREWLERQLQEMKAKIERSEDELTAYASKHGIIHFTDRSTDPKSGQARESDPVANKLAQLSANVVQATSERIAREAMYRELEKGELETNPVILSNSFVQALKKDLGALEAEYGQLSKVYKPDYPKMVRLREQMAQIKDRLNDEMKKTAASVKAEYAASVQKEKSFKAVFDQYKSEMLNLNEKMVQYQILKREVDTNRELYNGLLQRLKEAGVSASLTSSNVQILDKAEVPKSPHKPKREKNILIALLVGLIGGVGLVFFVEYLDNTVKTPDDLEKKAALPALGLVPDMKAAGDRKETAFLTFDDKKSPLSEAYRSIGTYIQFSSAARPPKTIQITSPKAGEGKTTTVINTAISLSHSYGKGIVLDCDLRKPQLHKIFDADNTTGISSYLAGHVEFGESLIQSTKVGNLDLITAGVIPPNPSELLSSHRVRELINYLSSVYSFIVIDSPPVLGFSDSLIISTVTDGVVLVVRAGDTPRDSVAQAKKLLQGVNAKILGAVLNGVTQADLKYGAYNYYYSYYYEEAEGSGKKKKKRDSDTA